MTYTTKQKKALQVLKDEDKTFFLFAGGARSGKSYVIIRYLIIRAIMNPESFHLVCRFRYSHAKLSIWKKTIIPELKSLIPDRSQYKLNLTDYIVTLKNGSEIWLGGLDDGDRVEKIMGTEFASIFINEATQVSYDTYQSLKTRLNDPRMLERFIMDCNPRAPSHWLHRVYVEHKNPEDMMPIDMAELYAYMHFIPEDNKDNISKGYIAKNLETMTGVKYKRYRQGVWCNSGEGTVYRFDRAINHCDQPIEYNPMLETWCSWDFGIADSTALIFYQIQRTDKSLYNPKGTIINIIGEYEGNNKPLAHYLDIVKAKGWNNIQHAGDPAGNQRAHDLKSWISKAYELSGGTVNIKYKSFYAGKVDQMIDNANEYIGGVRVCETQCPKVVTMFENWGFQKQPDGANKKNALPEHDSHSHLGTSLYYFFINRFPPVKTQIVLD